MRRLLAPPGEARVEPGPVPTISIVIPAYQAAAFVGDAVASALAQTVAPHEVIICDDGSTDDLAGALDPYRDRIVFLRRPHGGEAAARNAAIEAASGEFVALLDADDTYEPSRVEALGELAATRPDLDILATDLWLVDAPGASGRFYDAVEFPLVDQRLAILETCFVACPALRRKRVLETDGFDPAFAIGADWDMYLRLVLGGSRAGLVPEPLVRYRRNLSAATSDRARSLWARVTVLEKARRHPTLSPEEVAFVDRCLARARTRARLSDVTARARSGETDVRVRLRELLLAGDTPLGTRFVAAAAAIAPRPAAAMLTWEERRVARSRPRRPRQAARGR